MQPSTSKEKDIYEKVIIEPLLLTNLPTGNSNEVNF